MAKSTDATLNAKLLKTAEFVTNTIEPVRIALNRSDFV